MYEMGSYGGHGCVRGTFINLLGQGLEAGWCQMELERFAKLLASEL